MTKIKILRVNAHMEGCWECYVRCKNIIGVGNSYSSGKGTYPGQANAAAGLPALRTGGLLLRVLNGQLATRGLEHPSLVRLGCV